MGSVYSVDHSFLARMNVRQMWAAKLAGRAVPAALRTGVVVQGVRWFGSTGRELLLERRWRERVNISHSTGIMASRTRVMPLVPRSWRPFMEPLCEREAQRGERCSCIAPE